MARLATTDVFSKSRMKNFSCLYQLVNLTNNFAILRQKNFHRGILIFLIILNLPEKSNFVELNSTIKIYF